MMQMPRILKENSGFTLLEGIAVMIVIGIISAVAAISMMQTSSSLAGYTALLKTHLRYAQTLAMNSDTGNIWGIRFNLGANQYWLFQCADPLNCDSSETNSQVLPLEDADSSNKILLGDVGLDISSMTPGTAVAFDNNGIPQLGISAFSPQTANVTITLDDSDTGETKTVTITQQTGFIP
jgi:prepilin-type N-terminal cleavage/methylation domain-containing protein